MARTDPVDLPRGAIACLGAAAFASALSLRVNDAMLPKLASEFGVSLGTASQVISLFATAYGLAQLLFGPIGDRFGKYRVIGWAAVACMASAALCAAAPGFQTLRLARALSGATCAAMIPLSMAWIGDVVPYEHRQPTLARFLIGQILGLCTGVWLGGFAADRLSWRLPYVLVAILFAAVAAGVLQLNGRLPPRARTTKLADGHAVRHLVSEVTGVLRSPWARHILIVVFLEGVLLFGPFAFIATHLHATLGLSLSAAGALVMLFGLGGFVFSISARRLVAQLGEAGLARWGGALMGLSLLGLAFVPAWGWAVAGCFLLGLGYYMLHNTLQVNATQMAPDRRGAAVSAFAACFFLGQSFGVSLGGWWLHPGGSASFLVFGAIGVIAVSLLFVALRRRHLRAQPRTS